MPETPNSAEPTPDPVASIELPPDGTRVRATAYGSIEYDREEQEVEGELFTVRSPWGPPPNCWVNGLGVDPATVRAIPAAPAEGAGPGVESGG